MPCFCQKKKKEEEEGRKRRRRRRGGGEREREREEEKRRERKKKRRKRKPLSSITWGAHSDLASSSEEGRSTMYRHVFQKKAFHGLYHREATGPEGKPSMLRQSILCPNHGTYDPVHLWTGNQEHPSGPRVGHHL